MRKRKLTSILALALALLLAVSLLCAPALADEEDDPGEGSESPYTDLYSEPEDEPGDAVLQEDDSSAPADPTPELGADPSAPASGTGEQSPGEQSPGEQPAPDEPDVATPGDLTGLGFSEGDPASPENNEVTNPDVVIIPSDANALILMDNGSRASSGAPGDSVTIQLPLAVNKEYLPSNRYILRNIVVMPDIPTDGGVTSWPFDIDENVNTRYLLDMTYESTADVEFVFRISQYAVRGVYPVNFKVYATVWRYDDVNGTTVTEDVTFRLCVYVTVTDDGDLSGVVTPFGCLQVSGENLSGAYSAPSGSPGQSVTLRVPVINVGGTLTSVTVTPVVSGSLEDFPFKVTSANLARSYSSWGRGETKVLEWTFTVSPYATTGNKAIRFKTTYFENGAAAEGTFSTQMSVTGGYEPTALSVMVQGYELYAGGEKVRGLVAGQEAELRLTLVNNSKADTARKVLTNLNFSGSPALTLCPGSTDSAYLDSIAPGGTAQVTLRVMAKADAEAGSAMLGIGVYFESYSGIAGTASQNIMIPVSQKMELAPGTPAVYGKQIKGRETTVSLPLSNMGRGKVLSVRVTAKDGLKQDSPCYVGDILPGGSVTADVTAALDKTGKYSATLLVEYEDAAGNAYSLEVSVPLEVAEPEQAPAAETRVVEPTPEPQEDTGILGLTGQNLILAAIAAGVVLLLLILVIVLAVKLRRRDDA